MMATAAAAEAVQGLAGVGPMGYSVGQQQQQQQQQAVAAAEDDDEEEEEIPGLGDKRTKRGFSKRVTLGDLERYFEYPIEEVSKMMGVSTTIIKRLCRKYGIKRWPYRQVILLVRPVGLSGCARRATFWFALWSGRHTTHKTQRHLDESVTFHMFGSV